MATLYVAEFNSVGGTANHNVAGAGTPPITEQTVSISGSSTPCSNGFNTNTRFIRVHTDTICSIAFGLSPTASSSNMRLAAGQTEYFSVNPGQKIAVIANS